MCFLNLFSELFLHFQKQNAIVFLYLIWHDTPCSFTFKMIKWTLSLCTETTSHHNFFVTKIYQRLQPSLPPNCYEISLKSNWSCNAQAKTTPFELVIWTSNDTSCDKLTTEGQYDVPGIRFNDVDRCCRDTKTFSFNTSTVSNCLVFMIFREKGEDHLSVENIEFYPSRQTLSYIVFKRLERGENIAFFIMFLLTSPLNLLIFYHFNVAFKKKFIQLFKR